LHGMVKEASFDDWIEHSNFSINAR